MAINTDWFIYGGALLGLFFLLRALRGHRLYRPVFLLSLVGIYYWFFGFALPPNPLDGASPDSDVIKKASTGQAFTGTGIWATSVNRFLLYSDGQFVWIELAGVTDVAMQGVSSSNISRSNTLPKILMHKLLINPVAVRPDQSVRAIVNSPSAPVSLNQYLIASGLAYYDSSDPNSPNYQEFQDAARRNYRGFWVNNRIR